MSQGTEYPTKIGLLNAIKAKIFTNRRFYTTADRIQTAINDVVESLWGKTQEEVIYVIDDDNVADHVGVFSADNHPTLMNIPNNTTILSIETTTGISAMLLTFVTTPSNGKRLDIVGNLKIWQGTDSWDTEIGQFSAYYYTYRNSYADAISLEGFESFMYWNGVWFYNGY